MELTIMPATTLVRMLRDGECSARELLEAHIRRVEQHNPKINAIVTQEREAAREQADTADAARARGDDLGPLHGLPMTVKDSWDVAGMRTTIGVPWLRGNRPARDAALIERLRKAGAIVWGKSNLPFASYDWQCHNPLFGRCHNPWRLGHGPGGSSGGSAAAVAAGFSPLELGSDVAGSIRYPAHCCGVYGLRTSEGLLDQRGHGNLPGKVHTLSNLVSLGPLARTSEDIRLALEVLIDPDSQPGRQALREPPAPPLTQARIGWTETLGQVPICKDTRTVLESTLAALRGAGAQVAATGPPVDMNHALQVWGVIQGFELRPAYPWPARTWPGRWTIRGLLLPLRFGRSRFSRALGRGFTSNESEYLAALDQRDQIFRDTRDFFTRWDLWITPVAATSAFSYRRTGTPVSVDGAMVPYGEVAGMYNCPTAAMGHPILTIPAGMSRDGLPIGLQFHARHLGDLALLELAQHTAKLLEPVGTPNRYLGRGP